MLGKSLNMSFKELARGIMVDVLAKMIERIMLLTIEKFIIEKIFNIIWICVGVAFYSYTIGTLSSILNYSNKQKSIISSQFSFINEFSKEKNIDKKLLEKITINLEYID